VIVAGQPSIFGSVGFSTITSNSQVALLPAASVAVYFTTVVPKGKSPGPLSGSIVGAGPQLSVATGTFQFTATTQELGLLAVVVISAGQSTIVGGVLSCTITSKLQVAVFPEGSVAVYVTVVLPRSNELLGEWLLVIVRVQLSVAVGSVQVTVALQFAPAVVVMLTGQPLKTGGVTSLTVTINEQVD
jgi:hypothetical protein